MCVCVCVCGGGGGSVHFIFSVAYISLATVYLLISTWQFPDLNLSEGKTYLLLSIGFLLW